MAKAQSFAKKTVISGTETVYEFRRNQEHLLKDEMHAAGENILSADKHIIERLKWNAPGLYCVEDM